MDHPGCYVKFSELLVLLMLDFRRTLWIWVVQKIVAEIGDNLSPKTATVAKFDDCSRQCGQVLRLLRLLVAKQTDKLTDRQTGAILKNLQMYQRSCCTSGCSGQLM